MSEDKKMKDRTTVEGYEIAKSAGLVLMVMIFQYPFIEIIFHIGEWVMPVPLRLGSLAVQAFAVGVLMSKKMAIWQKSE